MKRASLATILALGLVVSIGAGALAASGCATGKSTGPAHLGGGKESGAAAVFPVTRRIPGNATMFLATARLDHGVQLVRDLLKPLGRAEEQADPAKLDQLFRKEIGFSPISAADLADFGFAVDRDFAVYSTAFLPTFVLPVADAAKVNERIAKLAQGSRMVVSEHRGLNLSVIRESDVFVGWAISGDYLFVHVGGTELEKSTTDWLNEILDAKATLATQDDLEWAWQRAEGQKEALGLARTPALFAAARAFDRPDTHSPECDQMNARIAGAFGRVAVSAALSEGKADARGFLELAPAAASALAAHVALPPDSAYLSIREQAGLSLGAGVDLGWFGPLVKTVRSRDCGIVPELIAESDLDDVEDPLTKELGKRALSSYHVALLGGSAGFTGVDVQAVGFFGVVDEAAVKGLVGQLGGGDAETVSGQPATKLSIPGSVQPLEYSFAPGVLHAAMGPGLLAKLLGNTKPLSQGPAPEIFSLALRPDKLPDLLSALQLVGGHDAEILARIIGEYRWMRAAVTSENGGVRVVAGFELR
jgi:hypothetical protein